MDDTQQPPPTPPPPSPPPGPSDDFDPHRLRSITDMHRSRGDRVVAGVCAGAARYLGLDPVVVRVVVAVLTLAGGAGLILYLAAWLLLPADGEARSIAADWFRLDRNEEQVRVGGLVVAASLAVLAVVGNSSWGWWGDAPWGLVPLAVLVYVFWVRPRRRREEREAGLAHGPAGGPVPPPMPPTPGAAPGTTMTQPWVAAPPRERRSPALLLLTLSLAAIALAVTAIYEATQEDVPFTAYVAVALAVVAVGVLVSSVVGDGGLLVVLGAVLAVTLAVGSVVPNLRIGEQLPTPQVAADLETHYRHGVGQLDLDLTEVADPEQLLGRTVQLDAGVGETRVFVPAGLNVAVRAEVDAGEISLFGREDDGTDVSLSDPADRPDQPALTIDIDQRFGQIEVITR